MKTFIYRAYFMLRDDVTDIEAARRYLTDIDMTEFLLRDSLGTKKVKKVEWHLTDENSGYIQVETSKILHFMESKNISDWIRGQCSDGLGEGFEQQPFACYVDDDDFDRMASFDWETNNYTLSLEDVRENASEEV